MPLEEAAERTDRMGLVPAPIALSVAFLNSVVGQVESLYLVAGNANVVRSYVRKWNAGERIRWGLLSSSLLPSSGESTH